MPLVTKIEDNSFQGLFNQAVSGVYHQGQKCVDGDAKCQYRLGGLACAVGFIITDEVLAETDGMDGESMEDAHVLDTVAKSIGRSLTTYEESMFSALQRMHDETSVGNHYALQFLEGANNIANEYGLQPWEPDNG